MTTLDAGGAGFQDRWPAEVQRLRNEHLAAVRVHLRARVPAADAEGLTVETFARAAAALASEPGIHIDRAWLLAVARRATGERWHAARAGGAGPEGRSRR